MRLEISSRSRRRIAQAFYMEKKLLEVVCDALFHNQACNAEEAKAN